VAGAFVAGSDALVEWLLQTTRSYIFATAAPALLASALRASLKQIEQGDARRAHLQALIVRLREGLQAALTGHPWQLGASTTAIQPLVIGPNDEALAVMDSLRQRGLWVPAIRPPTVAPGTARLRIALSAAHTVQDIDRLVAALSELAASTHR
jgi:8-amino-7-oxononanoate synthase